VSGGKRTPIRRSPRRRSVSPGARRARALTVLLALLSPVPASPQVPPPPVTTQIVPEGGGPLSGSVDGVYTLGEDLGTRPGGPGGTNLLFGLERFDVGLGDTALFTADPALITHNLVARVNGGTGPSQIFGTLASDVAGADLYLLNPRGIVFGREASLDVKGSFFASSADEVRLVDDAGNGYLAFSDETPLLVATPRDFGFLGAPAPIEVRGSQLAVPKGESFGLIGGDLLIEGRVGEPSLGFIDTSGGPIDLASLGSPGTVHRIVSPEPALVVDAEGSRGDVRIASGAIVNATGIQPGVFCNPCGEGSTGRGAGEVRIRARDLTLEDAEIRAMTPSESPAGDVDIDLSGDLLIRQTGDVTTGISAGSGLDQVVLENTPLPKTLTEVPFTDEFFLGTRVRTRYLEPLPDVKIPVQIEYIAKGPAGDVRVSAANVTLESGGRISTTSFYGGEPGSIEIQATGRVAVIGADAAGTASTLISNGQGGSGAGSVTVSAQELLLDRGTIVTETRNTPGSAAGPGGDIAIDVGRLVLSGNARIDSSTRGASDGGDVTIHASELVQITGGDPDLPGVERAFSGISAIAQDDPANPAAPGQIGAGGAIAIETPRLVLADRAEISARSDETAGGGGAVSIAAARLELSGDARIATSAEGDAPAGDIQIGASDRMVVEQSTVSASVSGGAGGGGSIGIDAGTLVLDDGNILTTGAQGPGGDIAITANVFFASPGSVVSARSEQNVDGRVTIVSPVVAVDEGVAHPEIPFLDPTAMLGDACAIRAAEGAAGSFQVAREGIPLAPDRMLLAFPSVESDAEQVAAQVAPRPGAVSEPTGETLEIAAAAFDRGTGAMRGGRFEEAQRELAQASEQFAAEGNPGPRSDALRAMAESQQAAGRYAESVGPLAEALAFAEAAGDRRRTAAAAGSLGNAYLALGNTREAEVQLERAVAIARGLEKPALTARLLVNLGNLDAVRGETEAALANYQESGRLAEGAGAAREEAIALANAARSALAIDRTGEAERFVERAEGAAQSLPSGYEKAILRLNLADLQRRIGGDAQLLAAYRNLTQSIALAESLEDARTLSLALGHLGELYEAERRYDEALQLTRRALGTAEDTGAPDLRYRWLAQEGRLLWAQGRAMDAHRAYRRAIAIVDQLRPESCAQYGATAAEFRRVVAPVYLDFVDTLLQGSDLVADPDDAQRLLREARSTMERFKVAELRDYYRDECVAAIESRAVDLDRVSREARAAVVYPILLPDRLELLVSLPSGLRRYTVPVSIEELADTVETYRVALLQRADRRYLAPSETLYDWLVRPYAEQLEKERVTTLVFVPDGPLRRVPMAALHDGETPLVQRYALAVTPGLSLVDPGPLGVEDARFLFAGVSEPVQGFQALPNALREIAAIQALYGGDVLLDDDFDSERFESELATEVPSVVHIASHAVFTGDPATSFVVTHDDRITMDRLRDVVAPTQFRERPLELLVLSACETAAGDDRAALGLAGIAVRSGARSALGSLWSVQDEATSRLMIDFYAALGQRGVSRAQALQRAQLALMKDPAFRHPFYWSPFLLISSWL